MTQTAIPNFKELRANFISTILAYSSKGNEMDTRDRAETFWDQTLALYNNRPYYNMDLIQMSLDQLPVMVGYGCVDMNLVKLAFTLQWAGPPTNCFNSYISLKLKALGWPSDKFELVQELARIRLSMQKFDFAPRSIMYDLNLIRLGLPEKDFFENLHKSIASRGPGMDSITFINARNSLFTFLMGRKTIYSNDAVIFAFEAQARENLKSYFNKVKKIES